MIQTKTVNHQSYTYLIYHMFENTIITLRIYQQTTVLLNSQDYPSYELLLKRVIKLSNHHDHTITKPHLLSYISKGKEHQIRGQMDYLMFLDLIDTPENPTLFYEERHRTVSQNYKKTIALHFADLNESARQQLADTSKQNWNFSDWIKFSEEYVEEKDRLDFRTRIEDLFKSQANSSILFKEVQLNSKLLADFEQFSKDAKRYNHSEMGLSNLLSSIYQRMGAQKGLRLHQLYNNFWKINSWRDSQVQDSSDCKISNFKMTTNYQTTLPLLSFNIQKCKTTKKLMFPDQTFNDQDLMNQYYLYDQLYYNSYLFYHGEISQDTYKSTVRQYSDDQVAKFVEKVAEAKAKYGTGRKYAPPTSPTDGVLREFDDNQKIALIGDWGTGLRDSYDLIDDLVLNQKATIVIHLGDVYYAGFPQQFDRVKVKIDSLRQKVPNLRYITIPGNHDYYTAGIPMWDYLGTYNPNAIDKQTYTFFCLRNKSKTLQYIGLDTGRNASGLFDEIDNIFKGTYMQTAEVKWAIDRIKQFKGQTILLTHHQMFSAYQKVIGTATSFGLKNQMVGNLISQQLFQILPLVSCWYWGHQHRITFFKPNAYGVPTTRLLGNSGFQVHHPTTYNVAYKDYDCTLSKYIPGTDKDGYFYHSGAIIQAQPGYFDVLYTHYTSSYTSPAQKIPQQIYEKIKAPIQSDVICGKVYRIKQSSSLSFTAYKDYIWLSYVPTDLIFYDSTNSSYVGPITRKMNIKIQILNSDKFLYLTTNLYLKIDGQNNRNVFRFVPLTDSQNIRTGDNLKLFNVSEAAILGRYFYGDYYTIAAGNNVELTPLQIYDPTVNNSDLPM